MFALYLFIILYFSKESFKRSSARRDCLYVEVYLIDVLIFSSTSLIALYISSAVAVANRLPNGFN